jgi:IS30 family transposase
MRAGRCSTVTKAQREELWRRYKAGEAVLWISRELGQRPAIDGRRGERIANAVSIRQRPAEVEDRAVPGHWEGDLVEGSRGTFIATLLERRSRFVILVKLSEKRTDVVVDALIRLSVRITELTSYEIAVRVRVEALTVSSLPRMLVTLYRWQAPDQAHHRVQRC